MENAHLTLIESASKPYGNTVTVRSHTVTMDEPTDLQGQDTGPTPIETMLAALAGCTSITLRMYANRKQWPLDTVQLDVDYEVRNGKPVITRTLHLTGNLDDEQRTRLLDIANKCPVHKMLSGENTPTIMTMLG